MLEEYITKLLKRFRYSEMHFQRTPMVTYQVANRKGRDREKDEVEIVRLTNENDPYRTIAGSLSYLASTVRPGISYAKNIVSGHQNNLT